MNDNNAGNASNGYKEKVNQLERQASEVFSRLHEIETRGCAMAQLFEQRIVSIREEVKDMKTDIDSLKKAIYRTGGGVATIIVVLNLLIRLL